MFNFFRSWRVPDELVAKMDELQAAQRDFAARVKVLEREIDDLHDFYRRLRARAAGDQRAANADPPTPRRSAPVGDPGEPLTTKEELRLRALGPRRVSVPQP